MRVIDGRPATLRQTCEDALRRLQTEVIDLYYLHRWDKQVPIEDSVGALSDLVRAGKIQTIGLSEVSATTLRKAHAVHPIAAVQTEYSLWTRNPEIAVLAACRELGVAFVPFSPVARGFLCAGLHDVSTLDAKDIRRTMPRFAPDNYARNLGLLPPYLALAQEAGCSPAQLALAWLLHKGEDLIPIPGTTSVELVRDYRSTPQVVTAANKLLAGTPSAGVTLKAQRDIGPEVRFAEHSDEVYVIDMKGPSVTARIKAGSRANGVAVHPDGQRVYVSNGGAASVSSNTSYIESASGVEAGGRTGLSNELQLGDVAELALEQHAAVVLAERRAAMERVDDQVVRVHHPARGPAEFSRLIRRKRRVRRSGLGHALGDALIAVGTQACHRLLGESACRHAGHDGLVNGLLC